VAGLTVADPEISVVVFSYNGAAKLGACLDALRRPRWRLRALRLLHPEVLPFSSMQCLQEGASNLGFYQGCRALRGVRT